MVSGNTVRSRCFLFHQRLPNCNPALRCRLNGVKPQAGYDEKSPIKKLLYFWIRRALRPMPQPIVCIACVTIGVLNSPPSRLHTEGGFGPGVFTASLWLYLEPTTGTGNYSDSAFVIAGDAKRHWLSDDVMHHLSVYIGQSEVAAAVTKR